MRKFSLLDSLRRRDWREPESVYWPLNEGINDRLKKKKKKEKEKIISNHVKSGPIGLVRHKKCLHENRIQISR